MTRRVPTLLALLVFLALLALPFAARPRQPLIGSGGEPLVILTPHNEAVRYELTRAFVRHMAERGRKVQIDWRTPGGTSEITRYLVSEYATAFERMWTGPLHQRWSPAAAAGFANPDDASGQSRDPEAAAARRAFLASNVGCGVDLLFGGGSVEAGLHAAAGRLVDSGVVSHHPEMFGDSVGAIPEIVGGEPFWDRKGRWVGTCLSGFGICYNRDSLDRLGIATPPDSWSALADPIYLGQLGMADPGKSGSVAKAFEMIIQEQMQRAQARAEEEGADPAALDRIATHEGWQAAMRLIKRIAANARYFSDSASRVAIDVSKGDAAAGMCIDFYGRFQAEVTDAAGRPGRMGFIMPKAGSSLGPDAIGLLRGAPHRALAVEFIEFVLSEAGQKIWSFRRGSPDGPERYSIHRLPISPGLYASAFDPYRADPTTNPYERSRGFVYHPAWTAPLFRAISFVVRVMCVDPAPELEEAYRALVAAHFPPRATALFDDVSAVDYEIVSGPLRAALKSPDAIDEVAWADRLVREFRDQYRGVAALARQPSGDR
jgi:iron(III) transport system substrate-binding protein